MSAYRIRSRRKTLIEPWCWNCGKDPAGRKLVTVREAARLCGVSIATVYRWMERFQVQWVKTVRGHRRIRLDSLLHEAERRKSE